MSAPPLAHSIEDAAARLSIGRTLLLEQIKEGAIHVIRIGNRTLVTEAELLRFLATLDPATKAERLDSAFFGAPRYHYRGGGDLPRVLGKDEEIIPAPKPKPKPKKQARISQPKHGAAAPKSLHDQNDGDVKFWRLPEVKSYTKLSQASIYRHLPKPIKLGRTAVWLVSEVKAFCDARVAESRRGSP